MIGVSIFYYDQFFVVLSHLGFYLVLRHGRFYVFKIRYLFVKLNILYIYYFKIDIILYVGIHVIKRLNDALDWMLSYLIGLGINFYFINFFFFSGANMEILNSSMLRQA